MNKISAKDVAHFYLNSYYQTWYAKIEEAEHDTEAPEVLELYEKLKKTLHEHESQLDQQNLKSTYKSLYSYISEGDADKVQFVLKECDLKFHKYE